MAADGEGVANMECTIVASSNPPPQLKGDVASRLAGTANLSSLDPPVVTLLPLAAFKFQFQQSSFIDIVQRRLQYYATMADHTPLPGWLLFDPETLTFEGVAPELSAFPQSWEVELIASDVVGFAGATVGFEVAIGRHQLVFVPEGQAVNVTAGKEVDINLSDSLFLDGAKVPLESVASSKTEVPTWLSFDDKTLGLKGTAPENVTDTNVTVTVTDAFGNQAMAVVVLKVDADDGSSLFAGKVGTLMARSGENFEHHFSNNLFAIEDIELQVLLPGTAEWLEFDSRTRTLSGVVPDQTESSTIHATIVAKANDGTASETQDFAIDIEPAKAMISMTKSTSSSASMASTAVSTPALAPPDDGSSEQLSRGAIAAIATGGVAALAVLAACLTFCCRRRRRRNGYVDTDGPSRRPISRPILPPERDAILVTKEVETDIEKNASSEAPSIVEQRSQERPPQIALDLPTHPISRRMKWSKRFSRISQASSIGNGEDAIRADNNIPEWGRESNAVHTPHDSFSVPTEMARSSRQLSADLSPSKRAFQKLRQKRQSQQSIGLGIDTGGASVLPRHSSRGARSHRQTRSSLGMSTVVDGSSIASVSTIGTGVLSIRASDFPRPVTRSTFGSLSIPALTTSEKRKSIRLVERSDSVADNRSMHEKRRSFIRNRASTSIASPLFAHGSRASSNPLQDSQHSRDTSLASGQRRSKRGKSQLTTYSESSSLEPQAQNHRRSSHLVRSTFAPSFPRAITRSSLGADDEGHGTRGTSSSGFETISSSNSEAEWRAEMALPRNERSWVLPNEASPTPPPVPPTSHQPSTSRRMTPSSGDSEARQKWKARFREHSSSPFSTAVAIPIAADHRNGAAALTGSMGEHRRNRLSEPISLVSSDSLNRNKQERPRLVHTNSKRPVSVDKVQRLSSLKAETEDARPGSEVWETMESAGLMPPNPSKGKDGTQRSSLSGPAFI